MVCKKLCRFFQTAVSKPYRVAALAVFVFSVAFSTSIAFAAEPPGEEITSGVTMSASSAYQGYPATNAGDGNDSTYWQANSGASGEWLQATLSQQYSLSGVSVLIPAAGDGKLLAGSFRVEVYASNVWQQVASVDVTQYVNITGGIRIFVPYSGYNSNLVRIYFTTGPPSPGAFHHICSYTIYKQSAPKLPGPEVPANQRSNYAASSTYGTFLPSYAVDDDDATTWSANSRSMGESFALYFYDTLPLNGVSVLIPSSSGQLMAGNFDVQVRVSGSWQTVGNGNLSGYTRLHDSVRVVIPFTVTNGDALRIVFTTAPAYPYSFHQIADIRTFRQDGGWVSTGAGKPGDTIPIGQFTATASSTYTGYPVSNLTDGNDSTFWIANSANSGEWLQFVFEGGQSKYVDGLMVLIPAGADGSLTAGDFHAEAYISGAWQQVSNNVYLTNYKKIAGYGSAQIIVSFNQVTTNQVRLVFDSAPPMPSCYHHVSSVEIYEKPVWLRSQEGYSSIVPSPWTAVARSSNDISVLGRTYTFNTGIAPSSIKVNTNPLLVSDIAYKAKSNGSDVTLQQTRTWMKQESNSMYRIGREGTFGPALWESDITTEYDGLVKVDFSVRVPAGAAQLDEMSFEIPFRTDVAKLMQMSDNSWTTYICKAIPDTTGVVWSSTDFIPTLWIGDETRGMVWCGESHEGWLPSSDTSVPLIEIERQADRVILRLKLFSSPLTAGNQRRIVFGLQATPVKTIPDNYQNKRLEFYDPRQGDTSVFGNDPHRTAIGATDTSVIWWNPQMAWFGMPEPADPVNYNNIISLLRNRILKPVTYFALTGVAKESPIYQQYGNDWRSYPGWSLADCENTGQTAYGLRTDTTWADYLVYSIKSHMQNYNVDGVYLDMSYPPLDNRMTKTGITAYPIFSSRDLMKRIYNVVMTQKPGSGEIILHNSATIYPPQMAYATMYLDGEQFIVEHEKTKLTPEAFRAEFMGTNYGTEAQFLPEINNTSKTWKDITSRNLIGMCLPHQIVPVPLWVDTTQVLKVWDRYDLLPIWNSGTTWYPYWQTGTPFTSGNSQIKVSGYTNSPTRSVIACSNSNTDLGVGTIVKVTSDPNTSYKVTRYCGPNNDDGATVMSDSDGMVWVDLPAWEYQVLDVTPRNQNTIYSENFGSGQAQNWMTSGGIWAVESYEYSVNVGASNAVAYYSSNNYDNFMYKATGRFIGTTQSDMCLLLRYQDSNNFYQAKISKAAGGQYIRLYKCVNGIYTQIGNEVAYNPPTDTNINFSIIATGCNISLNVNDGTFSQTIIAYDTAFKSGKIGLKAYNSHVHFDNIDVSQCLSYSENFDNGQAQNWTAISGTWAVENGEYSGSVGAANGIAYYTGACYDNFTLKATGKFIGSTQCDMNVLFRYKDSSNYYQTYISKAAGCQYLRIMKCVNGIFTQIGTEQAYNPPADTNINFTITTIGDSIIVTASDGINIKTVTATDSSFATGAIGLKVYNAHAHFDNIQVYQ